MIFSTPGLVYVDCNEFFIAFYLHASPSHELSSQKGTFKTSQKEKTVSPTVLKN